MSGLRLDDARKIGFNDSVQVEEHSLHVQTEVLTRGGIVIRTVILEGGIARFAESRPCPRDVSDLGALVALVESLHKQCLDELKREGAKWLAST